MPTLKFNDPMDFLEVTITGKPTEQLRKEARNRQRYAATVIHDDSDRVPQFGERPDLGHGVGKGPTKHEHTPEQSEIISHGGTLDGVDTMHKILPKKRPTVRKSQNYQYPPYNAEAEGQISGVNTGPTYGLKV